MATTKSMISDGFRVANAASFISNLGDNIGDTTLYVAIGRIDEWSPFENDAGFEVPMPEPTDEYMAGVWRDVIGCQKISAFNVRHVIPRMDWGDPIRPNSLSFNVGDVVCVGSIDGVNIHPSHPDGIQVYQCVEAPSEGSCSIDPDNIDNISDCSMLGGKWTHRPSEGLVENIPRTREAGYNTNDGYVWDYLYTIPLDVEATYVSNDWIVVPSQIEVDTERGRWGLTDEVTLGDNRLIYRTGAYYAQILSRIDGSTFSEIGIQGKAFRQLSLIVNPLLRTTSTAVPIEKATVDTVRKDNLIYDSGNIIFIENRLPTTRDMDQTEEIIFIIQF